jgi:hypothetical protein
VEPIPKADQRRGGPEDVTDPAQQAAPAARRPGAGQGYAGHGKLQGGAEQAEHPQRVGAKPASPVCWPVDLVAGVGPGVRLSRCSHHKVSS